jgi:hypothetical protein
MSCAVKNKEVRSLPAAGNRSDLFRTSLSCKPRSLMQVSLGWFDYSKCEEGCSNFDELALRHVDVSWYCYEIHPLKPNQKTPPCGFVALLKKLNIWEHSFSVSVPTFYKLAAALLFSAQQTQRVLLGLRPASFKNRRSFSYITTKFLFGSCSFSAII